MQTTEDNILNILNELKIFNQMSFVKYLNSQDIDYLQQLCLGNEIIPAPHILDEIIKLNTDMVDNHPEIHGYIKQLKYASHNFYTNLAKIIRNTWQQTANFEQEFEKKVKPHGQKFINHLKAIRYSVVETKFEHPQILVKCSATCVADNCAIEKSSYYKKILLRLKKILSFYPYISYIIYVVMAAASVILAGIGGFHMAINIDIAQLAAYIALYSSIVVLLLFIANFTIHMFEHRDITGRNVLAHNYKTLFRKIIYKH